jgi:hypothetical protein
MQRVSELHDTHGIPQRGGKVYTQVVHRMQALREHYGLEIGVDTQLILDDGQRVVMKAVITDNEGNILGSGFAEEIRGQGNVNKTSAIENCETSAVGRALASIGLSGGEYASMNELDGVSRKTEAKASNAPVANPQTEKPQTNWEQWSQQACKDIHEIKDIQSLSQWRMKNDLALKEMKDQGLPFLEIVQNAMKTKYAELENHPQPATAPGKEPDPLPPVPPVNLDEEIPF